MIFTAEMMSRIPLWRQPIVQAILDKHGTEFVPLLQRGEYGRMVDSGEFLFPDGARMTGDFLGCTEPPQNPRERSRWQLDFYKIKEYLAQRAFNDYQRELTEIAKGGNIMTVDQREKLVALRDEARRVSAEYEKARERYHDSMPLHERPEVAAQFRAEQEQRKSDALAAVKAISL